MFTSVKTFSPGVASVIQNFPAVGGEWGWVEIQFPSLLLYIGGAVHAVHGHASTFSHLPMCKGEGNGESDPKGLMSPLKLL